MNTLTNISYFYLNQASLTFSWYKSFTIGISLPLLNSIPATTLTLLLPKIKRIKSPSFTFVEGLATLSLTKTRYLSANSLAIVLLFTNVVCFKNKSNLIIFLLPYFVLKYSLTPLKYFQYLQPSYFFC